MFFLQDPLFSIHAISVPDMLVKSEGQNNDKARVIGDHIFTIINLACKVEGL